MGKKKYYGNNKRNDKKPKSLRERQLPEIYKTYSDGSILYNIMGNRRVQLESKLSDMISINEIAQGKKQDISEEVMMELFRLLTNIKIEEDMSLEEFYELIEGDVDNIVKDIMANLLIMLSNYLKTTVNSAMSIVQLQDLTKDLTDRTKEGSEKYVNPFAKKVLQEIDEKEKYDACREEIMAILEKHNLIMKEEIQDEKTK